MRLKRLNAGRRARALVFFIVLSATALTPAPALALPEGRTYEMVSPVYKGGYGVAGIEAIAPGGESVAFSATGVLVPELSSQEGFGLYLARRGPSGWSTSTLSSPPPDGNAQDFSASLESALTSGSLNAQQFGDARPRVATLLLHSLALPDTASSWELGGTMETVDGQPNEPAVYEGTSADLCHVVLWNKSVPVFLPEAVGTTGQQYDQDLAPAGGCPGSGSLRLVAVRNGPGAPEVMNRYCGVDLGIGAGYGGGEGSQPIESGGFNPISSDGSVIFFTTSVEKVCAGVHQLFARLGGEKTVEVSRLPSEAAVCGEEVPCPGAAKRASAKFAGADRLGTRVFFTTTAALSEDDKNDQNDLYMDEIVCPEAEPACAPAARELKGPVLVSNDEAHEHEAADVRGVVRIAPDGAYVYFVALGALSGANAEGAAPVKGADNMYVYDAQTASLAFVADLCSGPALSGTAPDPRCPRGLDSESRGRNDTTLWESGSIQPVQSTPDGRFFVFESYARLRESDTDGAREVYRYDAQSGTLERVSSGEAGYDADGNGEGLDAEIPGGQISPGGEVKRQYELNNRAITENGSTIVFTTAEPLSPDATNGLVNVYEWHQAPGESGEGQVSLISSGSSITSDGGAVVSETGRDIFFVTRAPLVPGDTDELADIYDARVEGGFAQVPAVVEPCSGDACQGPLTNPAPLLVPGSVTQAPGQNFAAPVSTTTVKSKAKSKPARCRKGYVRKKGRCVKRPKKSAKGKK